MNISAVGFFVYLFFVLFLPRYSLKGFCFKFRDSDCMDFIHSGI